MHVLERQKAHFRGDNFQYLGLALYNLLLTVLTLGIYYPWAKTAIRKFLWQETELAGSRFEWHGTGKEMFRGFIKAYLILGGFIIIFNFGHLFIPPEIFVWVILASYLLILAIIPLAIHGMFRYRLSRTSYRGIYFGYRGHLPTFYGITVRDFFLTLITFGIYSFWLQTNVRRYVMQNSRFGNVQGDYDGKGSDLFGLAILNGILVVITLYIYTPWAIIAFFKFHANNTSFIQNGRNYYLQSDASGGAFFLVLIKAALLTIFTLGIAGPIAELMVHRFYVNSLSLPADLDLEALEQTEESYRDATGDDMSDILDLGF